MLSKFVIWEGMCVPSGELRPDIVRRTDEPALGERTTKEGQLAQADRPNVSLYPTAIAYSLSVKV